MAGNRLRHVNGYLIERGDGYALVDCGWDTADVLETLRAELHRLGSGLDDLRALIVTHFHSDHYGLAGTLKRLAPVRLLMHRLDWLFLRTNLVDPSRAAAGAAAWLERNGWPGSLSMEEQRTVENFRRFTLVAPDQELEDGEVLEVGRYALRVVWTPGHSQGHICLYEPEQRVLLSGDHVLDPITPHVGVMRPDMGDPLGAYLASLRKVAALGVDLVLPAHGEPFAGLGRRVDELLAHHRERAAAAREALSREPATAADVAARLGWTRRHTPFGELARLEQRMAVAETLAHLESLRASGQVTRTTLHGRRYYEGR